ncbi:hypothetical protein [Pseudomonas mucidolens]|uniref:hypothetical protein n=1 Tax=Pseudomonas mucidolens TaxID=46679 RepID=UPI000A06D4E4|nr:hypothetical protein [Pseudomonas mucidolens]
MSDKPRTPFQFPAPFKQPLAVYPTQSVRVEDLDAPYPANPVMPVIDADLGLGIRHIENHLSVTFDKWFELNVGDVYEFYMGGQAIPLAWGEIRPGEETQDRYHLAIPQELVPLGWVPDCFGRVLRAGSGNESTSPPQTWLIKNTRPGGVDQDPGLPYHSELHIHLPADLQVPGAVLDADRAALGVVLTVDPYPEMHIRDTLEVYWNGHLVSLLLDADHLSGAKPIEVRVEPEVINRPNGSGLLTIRFRAHDEVLNFSGPVQQWSQAVHLESDLDPNLLERPYFLVDGYDNTQINFDTHGDALFEVEVTAPRQLPDGTPTPVGTQVVITLTGIRADGSPHVVQLAPYTARPGRSDTALVDNADIKTLINGSMQISYQLQFPLGSVLGTSGRLTVTIFGTVSNMPAVDVVEDDAGLIDPSIEYITVNFPVYEPYDPNYSVTLRMEAIRPGGGMEFYEQTLLAGDPPPPTRFRIVLRDDFLRFVGLGDVKVFYRVDDGQVGGPGAGVLTVRKSEDLTVQFGERVAVMPKPLLGGVDEHGNLDPDDVIGQAIVTLPYVNTVVGDTFNWNWVGSGLGGSTEDSILLNSATAGKPLSFPVDKAFVVANLNGEIRLSYSLIPASAEPTLRSEVLVVTVGQALGDLIRPEVVEASRNPDQLAPEAVTQGATIRVSFPQMLPTDRIRAHWTGIPGIGSHTETKDGNSQQSVDFTVPAGVVGANISPLGQSIAVQYVLLRGTRQIPSLVLDLLLLNLTTLPIPTIEGIGEVPILDISKLTGSERTIITPWHFIHRAQRMWMEYRGVYADGSNYYEATYTNNLVTAEGEANGILPPAPVDELRKLKDGSSLSIKFWVSFDQGSDKANAVLFRERQYTVQVLAGSLPHPFISGASGTGPSVAVEPMAIEANTKVTVKYDGMSNTDRITLTWIFQDCTEYPTILDGQDSGQVVFDLTAEKLIHRSVNSTVMLRYSIVHNGATVPSEVQTVKVNSIPVASLPQPLINAVAEGGRLDLTTFTGNALAAIAKWPLSATGQRVWLTCSSSGVADLKVIDGVPITAAEAESGLVNKPVLRTWLEALPQNPGIRVVLKVAFTGADETQAVEFPQTSYTVTTGLFEDFETWPIEYIGPGETITGPTMDIFVWTEFGRGGASIAERPEGIGSRSLRLVSTPGTNVYVDIDFKSAYSEIGFFMNAFDSGDRWGCGIDIWGENGYLTHQALRKDQTYATFSQRPYKIVLLRFFLTGGIVMDNFTFKPL